jgi:hypothetical protein
MGSLLVQEGSLKPGNAQNCLSKGKLTPRRVRFAVCGNDFARSTDGMAKR